MVSVSFVTALISSSMVWFYMVLWYVLWYVFVFLMGLGGRPPVPTSASSPSMASPLGILQPSCDGEKEGQHRGIIHGCSSLKQKTKEFQWFLPAPPTSGLVLGGS